MAAGLGGGMAVRGACGAMIGAVMIIGRMYAIEKGHSCPHLRDMVKQFMQEFEGKLQSQQCSELLEIHQKDCRMIIDETAKLLDKVVDQYK